MNRRWLAAVLILAVVFTNSACSRRQEELRGEEHEKVYEEKEIREDQDKLDAIFPSAYGNVKGLTPEPGTYISIIGKSADGLYWDTICEGAEQAAEDINDMLGY